MSSCETEIINLLLLLFRVAETLESKYQAVRLRSVRIPVWKTWQDWLRSGTTNALDEQVETSLSFWLYLL